MVPYVERIPTHRSILLLVVLFGLLYFPDLGVRELRPTEAVHGTIAREMLQGHFMWTPRVHGDRVEAYPMYAWLVAGVNAAGLQGDWAVRLPAAISIGVLGLCAGIAAYRWGGPLAGVVAASVVVANVACLRVGHRAQTETVLAAFLTLAWLVWYALGQQRKLWTLAWLAALCFVVLATFTAGAKAIAYFYLPFVFLRRPVRGRRRLLLPSHVFGLAVLIGTVWIWLSAIPDQIFLPWNELKMVPSVNRSYFRHLFVFPIKCGIYLFPWTLMAWPPFCMAFRPLEKRPAVFHYLRTIVLTAFISTWLFPNASPLALLPVLPALAIMVGLHFEILARRHLFRLRPTGTIMAGAAVIVGAFGLVVLALHGSGIIDIHGLKPSIILLAGPQLAAAVVTGAVLLRGPARTQPLRIHCILAFAALAVAVMACVLPWKAWLGNERKAAGLALLGVIPVPHYLLVDTPPKESGGTRPSQQAPGTTAENVSPQAADSTVPTKAEKTAPVTYRPLSESVIYSTTKSYFVVPCFYLRRPIVRVSHPRSQIPLPAPAPDLTRPASSSASGAEATHFVDAVYALSSGGPPILPEVEWEPLTPTLDLRRRKALQLTWFPGGMCLLRLSTRRAPLPGDHIFEPVRLYRGIRR